MKLIFRYLKPYILTVLAVIALTFMQVQTELTLPDYMSGIVTNGIQYGGIIDPSPKAVTKEDMDSILIFAEEADQKAILSDYRLIEAGSTVLVEDQDVRLEKDVYFKTNEDTENDGRLLLPLVYSYMAKQQGIDVHAADAKTRIGESLKGLEDNYASMARLYIRDLYENVGLSGEKIQNGFILMTGLKMLGIAAIGVAVQILSTYLATRTSSKIAATMRKDVFEKVESFSSSEFSRFSTSSLITRTGNDITKIQQLIQMMMRMMLMSPIMGITAVIKVMRYPNISWLLVVAIGVIVCAMVVLALFAVPKFEVIQKLTDRLNSIMREFLDGMLVIRAFNSEKTEEEKFDDINSTFRKTDRFVSNLMNIMGPVITFVMNALTVSITWFAAKQIDIDAMSIGEMMAFTQYAMHVVMSFMFVTVTFFMIPRSLVSVKRIEEVLNTVNTINDPKEPVKLPEENGPLCFEHVSFRYPGAEESVLEDVSFSAEPGETVAFIGSTGSGKSTVVKLIPRLFDVSEGKITYCGIDLRDLSQKQLHEKIGLATQKAVLFTGDIRSNIEFGRDVSEQEMAEAVRISQSESIVREKEEGLSSPITQGGTNVSGGQKQRLSIARALAKQRNIYIFDDCFSALDYATDKKLRAALNELIEKTKATVFIVAQRISTIKNADKIIVLDEGKIVGEGKHADLLKDCEVYRQIAYSQLSKEELV
ncbi:MAG: ABC transporter ATP-binding protein/permease [Erysipelotrichaceae bacterium]|nr:ABC transporter ATP-binding protein/permease [Erysipelotrichaceae bacterium]